MKTLKRIGWPVVIAVAVVFWIAYFGKKHPQTPVLGQMGAIL